jgi:acetylornithine deacetylase/succinyl-diaminopimelate desuccinylase-like protein
MSVMTSARSASGSAARADAWARGRRREFVDDLRQLVRFPTISAQPTHAADMRRCAHWLAERLRRIGLSRIREIGTGPPIVSAEWMGAPGRPTLLVYGHYDVQPAEPLGRWTSPPFEPAVRGKDLFGRGASDDKGQMLALLWALDACLRTAGRLPVNVRCLLEGEEEIGSPSLIRLLHASPDLARADAVVVSDMPILGPDRPAITYSLRGAVSMELEVRGPGRDLHSGLFGGAIDNPLQALASILASLHHPSGRVAVPGFYDRVRRPSADERRYMARVGPSDAQILRDARARRAWGERGYSLYERTTVRPAVTVNGISGGYVGPGSKGVIPATALAKLSVRLVPDQDPREIDDLVRRHVHWLAAPTVRVAVRSSGWADPAVVKRGHPTIQAAAAAYRTGFGAEPVFIRCGGTIPIVPAFQRALGVPVALMGFALPDDRMHAPNEKVHLPNLFRGVATAIAFLDRLSRR